MGYLAVTQHSSSKQFDSIPDGRHYNLSNSKSTFSQPPSKHSHALLIQLVVHTIVKHTQLLVAWPSITAISLTSLMESKQIHILRCKHAVLVINQKVCAWEMTFIKETQTSKNTKPLNHGNLSITELSMKYQEQDK